MMKPNNHNSRSFTRTSLPAEKKDTPVFLQKIKLKDAWNVFRLLCLVLLVVFFNGCYPGPEVREEITRFNSLKKLKPKSYPVFMDQRDFDGLTVSIDRSLKYYKRVPLEREYTYGKDVYTAAHMIASMELFKDVLKTEPSIQALNDYIKASFIVYEAAGNTEKKVLFTGYYEPTYDGSDKKKEAYPYPLYATPKDLLEIDLSKFSDKYKGHKRLVARVNPSTKRVVPYYTRQQINASDAFHTTSDPIVWLKSRVDRFFLEIQGSGRIHLDDGSLLRVHYAGSNGNKYRSVGRYLIRKNEILKENMSMQAIRTWLEQHPDRMDEVLNYNESFVFFQKETGGPYGSLGVEVTALRSIATDSRLFPKGALCFMAAQLPDKAGLTSLEEWENTSFFVLNQDTGGAIKGPARADLFCGNSSYAEYTAGHMNTYGKLYFMVLKPGQN